MVYNLLNLISLSLCILPVKMSTEQAPSKWDMHYSSEGFCYNPVILITWCS